MAGSGDSRLFCFAIWLAMASSVLACNRESEPQIAPRSPAPTPAEEQHWLPAAMGAVLVPSSCRATCTRSCDFDFGTFECTGLSQPAETYGGPEISVGTLLDKRDSAILGGETLGNGTALRWGLTKERYFSVVIADVVADEVDIQWQLTSPVDTPDSRDLLLTIARSYSRELPPEASLITCSEDC